MGDKSPKATRKTASQKKARNDKSSASKEQAILAKQVKKK